jgi:hypothetical protein
MRAEKAIMTSKTGVPIECSQHRFGNGIALANRSWPSPFDERTIRQQ